MSHVRSACGVRPYRSWQLPQVCRASVVPWPFLVRLIVRTPWVCVERLVDDVVEAWLRTGAREPQQTVGCVPLAEVGRLATESAGPGALGRTAASATVGFTGSRSSSWPELLADRFEITSLDRGL